MSRRVWVGVLAGVLAAMVMLGVAGAAYRIGERHEVVTRAVGDGEVVRVVGDDGWGYGHGGGGGFFFLPPLLGILLVFLLLRGRRGGGGWCGPGYGGSAGRANAFEEWHRQAHEKAEPAAAGPTDA